MPSRLAGLDSLLASVGRVTGISPSLIRFGMVGVVGLGIDTATVYGLRGLIGLYAAGAAGFLVAATANWAMNRLWTFRDRAHRAPHVQWLRFLAANLVGFAVNRGLFFLLITYSPLCHAQPILPIAAGSAAGLLFNYRLSSLFVFHS